MDDKFIASIIRHPERNVGRQVGGKSWVEADDNTTTRNRKITKENEVDGGGKRTDVMR